MHVSEPDVNVALKICFDVQLVAEVTLVLLQLLTSSCEENIVIIGLLLA